MNYLIKILTVSMLLLLSSCSDSGYDANDGGDYVKNDSLNVGKKVISFVWSKGPVKKGAVQACQEWFHNAFDELDFGS